MSWKSRVSALFLAAAALWLSACGRDVDQDVFVGINLDDVDIQVSLPGGNVRCPTQVVVTVNFDGEVTLTTSRGALFASGDNRWILTIDESGEYTLTATLVDDPSETTSITITFHCEGGGVDRALTDIDFVPRGGNYPVGWDTTAVAMCYDQFGVVMPCPPLTWTSSVPHVVNVSPSGVITCLTVGSAEIRVMTPGGGPSQGYVFYCQSGQSPDGQIDPPFVTVQAPGASCVAGTRQMTYRVNGVLTVATWSISNSQVATLSSQSGHTVTVTAAGPGTALITATGGGATDDASITVNACQPQGSIVVTVAPEQATCVVGSQATFGASVTGVTSGQSTAVTWTISGNTGVASIAETNSNSVVLDCDGTGTVTVTARSVADPSASDYGVLTVNNPPAPACPSSDMDYIPGGGSVVVNQTRVLTSVRPSSWPSGCRIIWASDRPSDAQVTGDTNVPMPDGTFRASGYSADLRGISTGSAIVCAQVVQVRSDGYWEPVGLAVCYLWTVTSASGSPSAAPEEAWVLEDRLESIHLKWFNIEGVSNMPSQ